MTRAPTDPDSTDNAPFPEPSSRHRLVWDVTRFQIKLVVDGLVDVVLSPLAIGAALLGLLSGGNDPHRYFRELLRIGRRVEIWLNLFGVYRRRGTADEVMDDLRDRVLGELDARKASGGGSDLPIAKDSRSGDRSHTRESSHPESSHPESSHSDS